MKHLPVLAAIAIVTSVALLALRDVEDAASPVGDPVTYLSADGEPFEAQFMSDDTVDVRLMPISGSYLKGFTAERERSASGERYTGTDGRFEFLSKGGEASIYMADGSLVISGVETDLKPYARPGREVIYFDPRSRDWRDPSGKCHSCIAENGFGRDGQIAGTLPVYWHELRLDLKSDLGENPPLDEVKELFELHYSTNPAWYGTHVELNEGVFRILVATDRADTDFLVPSGAIRAWYTVTGVEGG